MIISETIDGMITEKLLNLHTAFIAKVITVESPKLCSVQPLDKIKAYGKKEKEQAVISRVPVLNHVRRYTLVKQSLSVMSPHGACTVTPNPHPAEDNIGHLKVEPIKPGDLVFCVCAERDISASVNGESALPPVGHHGIKDAVVVGLLGGWPHE